MDPLDIKKAVETLLFITDHPLPGERLSQILGVRDEKIRQALTELEEEYSGRTLQIANVAGGYQMATRKEYGIWVRKLYHNRMTIRLSAAALETLAIVAYKQPITRAEIEAIRGVEVIGPLETLLERRLITSMGRKETVGRPMVYGTTKEFLRQFGLNTLDDLPPIGQIVPELADGEDRAPEEGNESSAKVEGGGENIAVSQASAEVSGEISPEEGEGAPPPEEGADSPSENDKDESGR